MKMLAILLSLLVLFSLSASAIGEDNPTLSVVGEGMVTVPADMVMISVSVESSNDNAALADAENQQKLDETKRALIAAGVRPEDISSGQSSGLMSFQSSSRVCRTVNNSTICDMESTNRSTLSSALTLRLNTTDEARINMVMNAARSAGASPAVIGYSLMDTSSALSDARKKAIEDARSNAEGMANAAEVRLGKVIDISEYAYPQVMMAQPFAALGKSDMNVATYVVVTYEILE